MYAWVPGSVDDLLSGLDLARSLGADHILFWEADYIDNLPHKAALQQAMREHAAGAFRAK
jgi:hypothetical protein